MVVEMVVGRWKEWDGLYSDDDDSKRVVGETEE